MDKQLFDDDDSDNEVTFKANSEYVKKYNTLRRKEELLKLKNKYGDSAILSEDSSSSEDDDDDVILTEEFERDFFKTLSCLKKKDPRIYDNNVKFFQKDSLDTAGRSQSTKKSKDKPMTIRDYNRKIIVEKDGKISDDDEDNENELNARPSSPSYVQEQQQIKTMFSTAVKDEENEDEIGGLFSKKIKSKQEEEEEEKSYREWIGGQVSHLKNDSDENDLKPLKDFWSDPLLEKDEAFLRDYFLNQRFKEDSDRNRIPSYDEIVNDPEDECLSEDEEILGEQTEFEHKFNFRFEEPDQDFIKRYPRTLEHSLRRKDDKRAKKRSEVKERKVEEKKRKKEEIGQLKVLKLKEIQEKIEKLKHITGNDQLAFNDEDIEGDFDPDAHDRRMKELFDGEYYEEFGDNEKPEFPDLDEELEIDNWDTYNPKAQTSGTKAEELHCEDENFNMDCDYDPSAVPRANILDELKDATDGRRKRRKKQNKLAEALSKNKPVFDPKSNQTFAQYLDEYYKLDCEDVIGDMPCRFKYREVPPLDYGLTTAEILMADDDELNRWYPLKKTLQHREEHKQRNDHKILQEKSKNLKLKMKILPSLFKKQEEEGENPTTQEPMSKSKRKRNKRKRQKERKGEASATDTKKQINTSGNRENVKIESAEAIRKKFQDNSGKTNQKKIKKNKRESGDNNMSEIIINGLKDNEPAEQKISPEVGQVSRGNSDKPNQKLVAEEKNRKRKKKKRESGVSDISEGIMNGVKDIEPSHQEIAPEADDSPPKKKKKKNSKHTEDSQTNLEINTKKNLSLKKDFSRHKNKLTASKSDPINNLSDERLKAFGLNPKKYRSFMKFKKY